MQWIVPITVIPGIALIILSTSNFLISLNTEISLLNHSRDKYMEIINLKILQLKKLNWALVFLYLGVLFFLGAGIFGVLSDPENIYILAFMVAGILVLIMAILLLIIYGFKSIYIREKHLRI